MMLNFIQNRREITHNFMYLELKKNFALTYLFLSNPWWRHRLNFSQSLDIVVSPPLLIGFSWISWFIWINKSVCRITHGFLHQLVQQKTVMEFCPLLSGDDSDAAIWNQSSHQNRNWSAGLSSWKEGTTVNDLLWGHQPPHLAPQDTHTAAPAAGGLGRC